MSFPTLYLASIVGFICIMGSITCHADSPPSSLSPDILDNANLFSPEQIAKLQGIFERARNEGGIATMVVAETTMLRLSPRNRANELNDEFRDQWLKLFPEKPLAKEIDLASNSGPIRPTEMHPILLTFYFTRASTEGSQSIAVGGFDVIKSEIGSPEANEIYKDMVIRYRKLLITSKDPATAFLGAIEVFLNASTTRRAEIYRHHKTNSNNSLEPIIFVVLGGLVFAIIMTIALRKLGGKDRKVIEEKMLPKLPLKTRLGGRHSGGMTANLEWSKHSESTPSNDHTH